MLPRRHRLPLRFCRRSLQQKNHSFTSPHLTVFHAPRTSPNLPSRFAFIISKKLISKAVARNRFRRQLCHQLYQLLPTIPTGYDFLLLPKPKLIDLPPAGRKIALAQIFKTIKR